MWWRCTWGVGLRLGGGSRGWAYLGCPGGRFWDRRLQGSFPLDATVPRDVLLFEHERPRFFRLLGLFCAGQFLFWAYLAHFAFRSLRDTAGAAASRPVPERPLPTLPGAGGASLNLGSNKWRFGFTASCLTVGGYGYGKGRPPASS